MDNISIDEIKEHLIGLGLTRNHKYLGQVKCLDEFIHIYISRSFIRRIKKRLQLTRGSSQIRSTL